MANDMVAITASKLPAHLQGKVKTQNAFANAVSVGGFPVVSIRGKVFHIQRGDERTLITKGDDGDPAPSIEAVIVALNPNKSKVYYDAGYEEGSSLKPTCYSNNGISPAGDAEEPQAKKCQTCPHNQWGSRITDNGGKGKACGDSMRLAIAPPDQLNDPMLLRVPAASLKTLGAFGQQLAKRGVEPHHVVTRIGFDHSVAHPSLTFKAIRFVSEEEMNEIEGTQFEEEETLLQITGLSESPAPESEAKADAPAPAPAPKKSQKVVEEEEAVEAKPKPEVKVEKPAASVDDFDSIDEALGNLDFDD